MEIPLLSDAVDGDPSLLMFTWISLRCQTCPAFIKYKYTQISYTHYRTIVVVPDCNEWDSEHVSYGHITFQKISTVVYTQCTIFLFWFYFGFFFVYQYRYDSCIQPIQYVYLREKKKKKKQGTLKCFLSCLTCFLYSPFSFYPPLL